MSSVIRAQQQQWPRGPVNDLHRAACRGSTARIIALLSSGSINIDQGDPDGNTPLMFAAQEGHSPVARILVNKGANAFQAADGGRTALHLSAHKGHLAVTVDLIKAGAPVDARTREGATPLTVAAQLGHLEVMSALIEAGANVDSRVDAGATPLFVAATAGKADAVRGLLRAKANPLLTRTTPSGTTCVALDAAAQGGHTHVVCELIRQVGIKGCCGASGGVDALRAAAETGHVDIIVMLAEAGVVDTGLALVAAARWGGEAAVKCLLQQRQLDASPTGLVGYVNFWDWYGGTALFRSLSTCRDANGMVQLISPRVVRLLVDAGADTTKALRVGNEDGGVDNHGTPLAYTNQLLREKKVRGIDLTDEQLDRLEAVRRLLLRVQAVHATSWLWHSGTPSTVTAAAGTSKTTSTSRASTPQLALVLPILRRRRRGALLAPVLRWVEICCQGDGNHASFVFFRLTSSLHS